MMHSCEYVEGGQGTALPSVAIKWSAKLWSPAGKVRMCNRWLGAKLFCQEVWYGNMIQEENGTKLKTLHVFPGLKLGIEGSVDQSSKGKLLHLQHHHLEH